MSREEKRVRGYEDRRGKEKECFKKNAVLPSALTGTMIKVEPTRDKKCVKNSKVESRVVKKSHSIHLHLDLATEEVRHNRFVFRGDSRDM